MIQTSRWHGSDYELGRLSAAVERNCQCPPEFARGAVACGAHAIFEDERVLNHLLYVFRARVRFQRAEWTGQILSAGG
jgi:hypothetical protein